jgi:hypothetical protein
MSPDPGSTATPATDPATAQSRAPRLALRTVGPAVALFLVAAAIVTELREPPRRRNWHGRVFGLVPYDFRLPTPARVRRALWRPRDRRLLVPQAFGVGWTLNLGRVARLLGRA